MATYHIGLADCARPSMEMDKVIEITSMDHNYCTPSNKDASEQQDHVALDIMIKMEEDNVLITLPENIEEARKQGMTSSMIGGVVQDTKMCEFSRNIEPKCEDVVSSEHLEHHVKSMDHEANIKECSYSPQYQEGFKMEADSLNEEFISDRHFKKPYSIQQPKFSNKEYVISPQTAWNTISIKPEPDNENSVSPPQQFDEHFKMEESNTTGAEFVISPQIVDSAKVQGENTGEAIVNWSQPLQAITKVNHDTQGGTVQMELGPSAIPLLGIKSKHVCVICGKFFKNQADITLHRSQCYKKKLVFKCNVCGEGFFTTNSLKKHNVTHIEKCGVCGMSVIWLSLHMLNHTGERPHRCWMCGKVFIANSNTGSSNLISTNKNGFYDCDICGKEISGWNYFTLHMKRHTLRQIHLTCVCRTTHDSSSDTKSVVTFTQKGCPNRVKTCVNLRHYEEQGKVDVNVCRTIHGSSSDTKSVVTSTQKRSPNRVKTFINLRHNEEHINVDVNDNKIPCSFCDHRFKSRFELHTHILTHFKGRVQDCNVCVRGFTSEELLLKHLINHIESSMYDSCDYVIGVQKEKQSIILDKIKWGIAVNSSSKQSLSEGTAEDARYEQPNECDVWRKGINAKRSITEHMSTHSGKGPHKCSVCGKGFTQKVHLNEHMLAHTGQFPYKCDMCPKGFTRKIDYTRHILTHTAERPHKCGVCRKGFIQSGNLQKHLLTHRGKCPNTCGVCGKKLKQKSNLEKHMLTHTGKYPHKCGVCRVGYMQKFFLMKHMLTHTGIVPYKCCVCGDGFKLKAEIIRHMSTHKGDWSHKCGVCSVGFKRKDSISKHLSTHKAILAGIYQCIVCRKGFQSRRCLSNHMLSHNRDLPHKCDWCGKEFSTKNTLTEHVLTHTGK